MCTVAAFKKFMLAGNPMFFMVVNKMLLVQVVVLSLIARRCLLISHPSDEHLNSICSAVFLFVDGLVRSTSSCQLASLVILLM